jgi:hypothetical protein
MTKWADASFTDPFECYDADASQSCWVLRPERVVERTQMQDVVQV